MCSAERDKEKEEKAPTNGVWAYIHAHVPSMIFKLPMRGLGRVGSGFLNISLQGQPHHAFFLRYFFL